MKEQVNEKEKNAFERKLIAFQEKKATVKSIKNQLNKLAKKYNERYLLQSLFFEV